MTLNLTYLTGGVLVMALVTYLPRMLPLVLLRKRIESHWLQSFLYYIPYAVLAAMTLPDLLLSTGNLVSALVGGGLAVLLAWRGGSLLTVALCSAGAVWLTELFLR